MNFFEELKKYFETTPKDVIKKHWDATEQFDQIGPTVEQFNLNNNIMNIENELAKAKKKLKKLGREIKELKQRKEHISDTFSCVESCIIEDKPIFKVGDFITNKDYPLHFGIITEITEIKDNEYYYHGFGIDGDYVENDYYDFHGADYNPTEEQILQHLIKVAEIKGLVKDTKFKSAFSGKEFKIKGFYINRVFGNLISNRGVIWERSTNTWAKKVELDFSILNDVDVFYVEFDDGPKWLIKGNPFEISNKAKGVFLKENPTTNCNLYFNKKYVKTLRKATQEQEKEFYSKFPKYEVSGVISENKYCISDGSETKVFVYGKQQLAEEICEFLNKNNV